MHLPYCCPKIFQRKQKVLQETISNKHSGRVLKGEERLLTFSFSQPKQKSQKGNSRRQLHQVVLGSSLPPGLFSPHHSPWTTCSLPTLNFVSVWSWTPPLSIHTRRRGEANRACWGPITRTPAAPCHGRCDHSSRPTHPLRSPTMTQWWETAVCRTTSQGFFCLSGKPKTYVHL